MSNGNNGGAGIALAMSWSLSHEREFWFGCILSNTAKQDDKPSPTPTPTPKHDVVVSPDEINPSNCQGETMVMKRGCHNTDTGEVYDGTPGKCGPGKELWVPDPEAPGYVAAVGDGTCEGELRDCSVDCPTPCSGGEWKQDPSDYCKIITYDNSNPPQKVETRLDGTSACGTGVVSEILDETRGNFVEARGLGACTKQRVGSCEVACPAGMTASSGCAYYANRQKSANGCMKVDANGDALEYSPDGSNNVDCGESGKQEFFYLPINASGCGRLSEWEPCSGEPCKVHCVGNWRQASPSNPEGWEACTGTCGEQPQKMRKYHISQGAQHGGDECTIADEFTDYTNCGSITPCCEVGAWQDGTCASNGFMTQTRDLTENKSGACEGVIKTQPMACCYQAGNWTAEGTCGQHQAGKQKYTQTTTGYCTPGTEIKYEDCKDCVYKMQETNEKLCFSYFTHPPHKAVGRRMVVTEPAVGTGGCPTVKGWQYGNDPLSIIRHIPSELCDKTQDTNYLTAAQNNFEGLTWTDV
jgi:hypothetical protein